MLAFPLLPGHRRAVVRDAVGLGNTISSAAAIGSLYHHAGRTVLVLDDHAGSAMRRRSDSNIDSGLRKLSGMSLGGCGRQWDRSQQSKCREYRRDSHVCFLSNVAGTNGDVTEWFRVARWAADVVQQGCILTFRQ
jgi:hypothetical protein